MSTNKNKNKNKKYKWGRKAPPPKGLADTWPNRTPPMWCYHDCGMYVYLDKNVLSDSGWRITIQCHDNEKHQCPRYYKSKAYDPNWPRHERPANIETAMVEPEPEPEESNEKGDETREE